MNIEIDRLFPRLSRGSRYQVALATVLLVIIPLLSFAFVGITVFFGISTYSWFSRGLIAALALTVAVCGYMIIHRYPRNIIKLRQYLERMAEDELPERIHLVSTEDDTVAIEKYLNNVLEKMRNRNRELEEQLEVARRLQKTIEAQSQEILAAERQRVMVQSLGAACHHIGQPMTVLRAHMDMLRRNETGSLTKEDLANCARATEAISEVLDKLRTVNEYRTEPYQVFTSADGNRKQQDIIAVE